MSHIDLELWAAIEDLDDDYLSEDLPEEQLDEELRALGLDPHKLAESWLERMKAIQASKEPNK